MPIIISSLAATKEKEDFGSPADFGRLDDGDVASGLHGQCDQCDQFVQYAQLSQGDQVGQGVQHGQGGRRGKRH